MAGLKIFVSYTSADRDWAHWIGWTLREAGHEPFVHEWEIGAGENIPAWMARRLGEADRLLGVFSPKYMDALFSESERTAAYWNDPMGRRGFLIPIEVEAVPKWPEFVAPLKRLSLVDLDQEAARAALVDFLKLPGPPKEPPKFPGHKPESHAQEAAAFAEGGEALAPREPLFPPQERQLIGAVAQEKGVDPERLRPILENLGLADVPVDEIADKLREAVEALRAKADEAPRPSNAGPDLDAARAKAGEKLRALDTDGALAVWDAFMAEDAFEAALRRRTAALKEKADILRLRYDYAEAQAALREVVRLDPDATWSYIALGEIATILNDSTRSLQAFRAAEAAARRRGDDRDLAASLDRIGNVLLARGDLVGALARYEECSAIVRRLASTDPSHADHQRAVSVSLNKTGDVLVAQGDLAGALARYKEGLAIRRRLASADSSHTECQRDLSFSLSKTGDVLVAQGDVAGALTRYEEGLEIARRLANANPSYAEHQRNLSAVLNRTGDILLAQGDLAGALARYEEGLKIRQRLASADPSHSERQLDVSVNLERTGDVLLAQGDLAGALTRYEERLAISRRLASADPSHAEHQRNLSVGFNKTGDVLRAQDDLAGALARYQEGLEIIRRLASADPSHAERQRDLSVSLDRTGDVLRAQGDLAGALARYEEGLQIRRRLASADPSHAERRRDLFVSLAKLADAVHAQGEPERACRHLQEGLEIMRPLAERFPEHPRFRSDLQWIEDRRKEWGCGGPAAAGRKRKAAKPRRPR
ncbi:MAG TPA: tetratricopeptide repeat protein [Beijerinckiaceae bacterium]|jgi:tetratricopeptide (TPR) repeat protein